MRQLVRVQKCNDDKTVLVSRICLEDCQSCTGCQKTKLRKVKNSIDAACGQVVVLTANRKLQALIRASYLLPVLLLLAGVQWGGSAAGIIGFLSGLALPFWLTTKETGVYTITGLSEWPIEKGDNDLD